MAFGDAPFGFLAAEPLWREKSAPDAEALFCTAKVVRPENKKRHSRTSPQMALGNSANCARLSQTALILYARIIPLLQLKVNG
jgi:hypothetical protein